MAQIERSLASLRIIGDEVDPAAITRLMGVEPSRSSKKGDEVIGKVTGQGRIERTGSWSLIAEPRTPEDLDGQIAELLDRLPNDLVIWKDLSQRFRVDLFCGIFMKEGNEGMTISSQSLLLLGERLITLDLDIYSNKSEWDE
jgi:hypothetical protein